MTRAHAYDAATLSTVADAIRDGEFGETDFEFDPSRQLATLQLWKADEELSWSERGGFLTYWHVSPKRRIGLAVRRVADVAFVRRSAGAGPHSLGGLRWDRSNMVYIEAYDGLVIELTVGTLDVDCEITDDVDRNRTLRS